jgi:hypothetical protein
LYDKSNTLDGGITYNQTESVTWLDIKNEILANVKNFATKNLTLNENRTHDLATFKLNFNNGDVGFSVSPTARVHIKGSDSTSGTFNFLSENSLGQSVIKGRDDRAVLIATDIQIGNASLSVGGNFATIGTASFGNTGVAGSTINAPSGWNLNFGGLTTIKDNDVTNSTWVKTRNANFQLTQDNIVSYFDVTNPTDKSTIVHAIARTLTSGSQVGDSEYRMTSSYWDGATGKLKVGNMIMSSLDTFGDSEINWNLDGNNIMRLDESTTAGDTRFMIYDVDNATLERVTVGVADSGGVGFKVLRIPN